MRRIFSSTSRTFTLTQHLASPFQGTTAPTDKPTANAGWQPRAGQAPRTNAEFADAAIRFCRTLW